MSPAGPFQILVVDDEVELLKNLKDLLCDQGYLVTTAASGPEAEEKLAGSVFDLILTDLKIPPPDGLELLRRIKEKDPETAVILMTAFASRETAREAIRDGAQDYIEKPFSEMEVLYRIDRIRERWGLKNERDILARRVEALIEETSAGERMEGLIARAPIMSEIFSLARRVAATDATVLLQGESGTGKTSLARAIHAASPRKEAPFLRLNCGAIPESLIESELFGYTKGAFTGAVQNKAGLLEAADGGTLLLDEIGELPQNVQVKLLQVMEEKSFIPVGGLRPHQANVRFIAATHRNLEKAVEEGEFRADLFYRIHIFPIYIPPLRERKEDIPLLMERFLKTKQIESDRITPEAMRKLLSHSFPGNVRELENILERALILAGSQSIDPEHLPGVTSAEGKGFHSDKHLFRLPDEGLSLEALERDLIIQALEKADGNKSRAARLLGLTRRTLYSRMEKHNLKS
ncbi:MAG: sigma-54 dependent transcriptional regulator [Candidatus Eisenbacteria bacterium]|uniref:Sigma-54 dependent transcriptional regulator n=1 Tax=Eiseniibacteriota bacterium TaxID=2212470 RepID=A0A948RUZ9_UNCEI|nr:sigma-54 dependent transcriptional regulator [Candidatus Eisenbacteria bacterium]MBU1950597.1 sigma-54 dependent transcriptional regulator [Candidatus Eisenbacteria bacterium]MBU2689457.1 sigma-54 dependent transcriptional regulator [Candidatus Eisenbacteria bacterium]